MLLEITKIILAVALFVPTVTLSQTNFSENSLTTISSSQAQLLTRPGSSYTDKGLNESKSLIVPKHLEIARILVDTVKPENNQYKDGGPEGVRMKGDFLTSENSVSAVCSSFVQAMLERSNSPAISKIKSNTSWKRFVRIGNFLDAADKNAGLTRIRNINEVMPGDLFMMSCSDEYCNSIYGPTYGHIAIVDIKPYKKQQARPIIENTDQWTLTVIDVDDLPHSKDDTRYVPPSEKKVMGVGRGSYFIYTDKEGVPVGYTSGFRRVYFDIAKRPIFFERPDT